MRIREVSPSDPQGWSSLINLLGIGIGSDTGGNRQMVMVTDAFVGQRMFTVADSVDAGATWNARFAVHQGGNVGINTPNPAYTLHVTSAGQRAVVGDATATSGVAFGGHFTSAAFSGRGVHAEATHPTGENYGIWAQTASSNGRALNGCATAATGVTFGVNARANSVDGRGVFGWASATTGANYGVYGESSSTSGGGVFAIGTATSGTNFGLIAHTQSPDGYAGYFTGTPGSRNYFQRSVGIGTNAPAFLLHLAQDSAAKPTSNTWTISSDARLKKNIRTIDHALDDLLALRGVTYQWIDPASQGDMRGVYTGMIAQEVERIFPEWVRDDANGYKTLTVIGFEGIVVEALRELRAEKDAELERLRGENAELRRRLDAVEAIVATLAAQP